MFHAVLLSYNSLTCCTTNPQQIEVDLMPYSVALVISVLTFILITDNTRHTNNIVLRVPEALCACITTLIMSCDDDDDDDDEWSLGYKTRA